MVITNEAATRDKTKSFRFALRRSVGEERASVSIIMKEDLCQ